jgi:hypothetical protein
VRMFLNFVILQRVFALLLAPLLLLAFILGILGERHEHPANKWSLSEGTKKLPGTRKHPLIVGYVNGVAVTDPTRTR